MSYLTLYVSKHLQKGKNFLIESFANYLATLNSTKISIDKFQYIRPLKVITIKLDMAQLQATPFPTNQYNYLDLQLAGSSDTTHYYYFITHKVQKASSTIELTCEMDVLNTFQWNIDYKVDNKTLVVREHKDRIVNNEIEEDLYQRNIDLRSEGINSPLYKIDEIDITDKYDSPWVLFYRNASDINPSDFNQKNPVDCYLMPKYETNIKYTNTDGTINYTDLNDGDVILIAPKYNEIQPQIKANDVIMSPSYNTYYGVYCVEIKRDGGALKVNRYFYHVNTATNHKTKTKIPNKTQTASSVEFIEPQSSVKVYKQNGDITATAFWATFPSYINSNTTLSFGTLTSSYIIGTSEIDRTDARNIKIIQLPYSPTDYEWDSINEELHFDSTWEYVSVDKMMKLKNEDVIFKHSFQVAINMWNPLYVDIINPLYTDARNDDLESKIYHSDYFYYKFVYDSFNLTFQYELMDFQQYFNNGNPNRLHIEFYASRNIVSKFLFKFPQYQTKYGTNDYDNIVVVSRNNEEVLYTSQYVNYLRNGYNFDVKSKERQETSGATGIGISIASTILGVLGSVATGNYGAAIIAGVGGALAIANQSVNYAKSTAQNEQNIQQKLEQSKSQAVSVLNADDIDLLNAYSGNKAKLCLYQISPTMRKALLDMFYYAGYATNELKTPAINTRYWFNYLQCELVLEVANNKAYLSDEIEEELKNRFKDGVTFFHYKNGTWDLDQIKENYESWILS